MDLTRGLEFKVGIYPVNKQLLRVFLRIAMLNIRYDYFKIILLDKGHDYKHKHIQGGNGCLFLQDRHVICHSVNIFCIMTALS